MKKFLSIFAASLLLAACSNDLVDDTTSGGANGGDAIDFGVSIEGVSEIATRAVADAYGFIGTVDQLPNQQMGVFASYTGVRSYETTTAKPNFMWNQVLTYNTAETRWDYNPAKYWPNSTDDHLTFFAYAPYVKTPDVDKPWKTYNIAEITNADEEGNPSLVYCLSPDPFREQKNASDEYIYDMGQTELFYGTNPQSGGPGTVMKDLLRPDVGKKVSIQLNRALACAGSDFTLTMNSDVLTTLGGGTANCKLYIDSIAIDYKNLTSKARLDLYSNSRPNWKPIISGEFHTNRHVLISRKDIIAVGRGIESAQSGLEEYYSDATIKGVEAGEVYTLKTDRGLFYIPLQVGTEPQKAEITLYYQILSDLYDPYHGTAKATYNLKEEAGKAEPIKLVITKNVDYARVFKPQIGDAYFSDGTWGKNPHADGAKPIGVVGYLGEDIKCKDGSMAPHGLVVALRDGRTANFNFANATINSYDQTKVQDLMTANPTWSKAYTWSYYYNNVLTDKQRLLYEKACYFSFGGAFYDAFASFKDAYDDVDGEKHTSDLMEKFYADGYEVIRPRQDAAYLCAMYEAEGVGERGKWHLGTFGEWVRIFDAVAKVSIPSYGGDHIAKLTQDGNLVEGDLYYTSATTSNERLLMPASGNTVHTGLNNWIQIVASYNAEVGHFIPYDLMDTEVTYWTSTQAANYYTYSFRMRWKEQDISFYGNNHFRARVDHEWNSREACLVRPILTF